MAGALCFMTLVSWLNAEILLEFFADIFGSSAALILWLVTLAAGGVAAFFIRKTIWHVKTFTALTLLVLYAVITGLAFSALLLGVSWLTFFAVVLVLAALGTLWNQPHALTLPGDSKRAALIWTLSVFIWIMGYYEA